MLFTAAFFQQRYAQIPHRGYCSLCKPWLRQRSWNEFGPGVETQCVVRGMLEWLSTERMSGAILSLNER